MSKLIIVIISGVLLCAGCKPTINVVNNAEGVDAEVIYAKNNDGIYSYDYQSNKSNKICTINEVFIANSIQSLNDSTVVIAIKPKLDASLVNSVFYVLINLNNGTVKTYKQLSYIKEGGGIKISIKYFDKDIVGSGDTLLKCNEGMLKQEGLKCCGFNYFISNTNDLNTNVFTKDGDVLLREQDTSIIIMNYEGGNGNRRKLMRGGYSYPTIGVDGRKVACQFKAGFGYKQGIDIFIYDLETKSSVAIIENDQFFKPQISKKSEFILLGKNKRKEESGEWIEEVHFYKISTNYSFQIAESNNYLWR